jgi:hypothetical protein
MASPRPTPPLARLRSSSTRKKGLALPPQLPEQLEAVQSRHHDIEQEQIVTAPQSPRQPAAAVVYNLQVHAAAGEESLHQLAELDVVIDEPDRGPRLGGVSP